MPDTGSVLRCNPDGTELEVFATGLRNPQELAFDEYGNLFTGDNNSDSGDKARWVYVVEGGDSGWRIGYQFIAGPVSRGPWNEEKLWHPASGRQAAYIVPPIANLADGPSGLTYDPGVSLLPDRYKDHFFLVDFRGASGQSGIRTFAVKPKGASFELVDSQQFVWCMLATDVDFGPDGALYFSDWVEGWDKPNKGRIYRVLDPARRDDPAVREVKRWLAEGMEKRSSRRARHAAGSRRHAGSAGGPVRAGTPGIEGRGPWHEGNPTDRPRAILVQVAAKSGTTLARIHAIWGLEPDCPRASGKSGASGLWPALEPLLGDRDPEVRAQAAKVLGESREVSALDKLVGLLKDQSPRVRFFAALALGKLGRNEAVGPLLEMLRDNADKDPYLRHAGVMGMVGVERSIGASARGDRFECVGSHGSLARDATASRSRDRRLLERSGAWPRARGRSSDQRRADRRGDAETRSARVSPPKVQPPCCAGWPTPTSGLVGGRERAHADRARGTV